MYFHNFSHTVLPISSRQYACQMPLFIEQDNAEAAKKAKNKKRANKDIAVGLQS